MPWEFLNPISFKYIFYDVWFGIFADEILCSNMIVNMNLN